jgi:hypothetical protein
MATSLKIFGIILGLLGLGIVYLIPWDHPNFIGYLLVFWIPAAVFYGMGYLISSRDVTHKEQHRNMGIEPSKTIEIYDSENIEGRLHKLDELKDKRVISEIEWKERRAEILDEV